MGGGCAMHGHGYSISRRCRRRRVCTYNAILSIQYYVLQNGGQQGQKDQKVKSPSSAYAWFFPWWARAACFSFVFSLSSVDCWLNCWLPPVLRPPSGGVVIQNDDAFVVGRLVYVLGFAHPVMHTIAAIHYTRPYYSKQKTAHGPQPLLCSSISRHKSEKYYTSIDENEMALLCYGLQNRTNCLSAWIETKLV